MQLISRRRNTFLNSAAALALLSFGASAIAADQTQAATTRDATYTFDIPAQELDAALRAFAGAARQQIVFDGATVRGKTSRTLTGTYTADDGIRALLTGTGLSVQRGEQGAFMIRGAERRTEVTGRRVAQTETIQIATDGTQTQPMSVQASRTEDASFEIEEVIVTAQKRAERLQDVPQSVTVLSADQIAKLGAVQFRDFAATIPGLSFQTAGAGTTQITLRGVTTGFDVSPTTGVYVDDVPYGSSTAFAQGAQAALDVALFDLARIEVLRGPQGTLYGASTMGGLVKYATPLPDTGAFSGSAQAGLSGTQHGSVNFNAAATVNVPLAIDRVALRASAYESRDGGYIDNAARGDRDVNKSDVYGARADLLFAASDALKVRISGFLQDISRDGEATVDYALNGAKPNGSLGQRRAFAEPYEQRFRLVSGAIDYDFGGVALTSISSYQTTRLATNWDITAVYVPLLSGFRAYSAITDLDSSRTRKFTQEVRLASVSAGPIEWVVGGFYTDESSNYAEEFVLRDPAGRPAVNDLYTFRGPSKYQEYAGFGNVTWNVTERFSVTGGLRYARNEQTYTQFGAGLFIASRPPAFSDENVKTYVANARYRADDHTTLYLRYATGYRPGGPNISANDPVTGLPLGAATFAADTLKSYEAGVKTETDDRRLSAELAVYHLDWSNIQIQVIRGGFALRANAPGGAQVRGGEVTLTARPSEALTFNGVFAYQDASLSQANADLGAARGERLPNVPRFTAAMDADYRWTESDLQPRIGATFRHVSRRNVAFNGSASQYRLPAYAVLDVRTGIAVEPVDVQFYVRNVTDKRGQISNMLPQFGNRIGIIQPRTIGVSASTAF